MRRPKAIDLFSGAGGMSLGFEQAGFDVISAVELDPVHAGVHKFNFPYTNVMCRDITQVKGSDLLETNHLALGEVDVVFGGPPCQGFSLMGKRLKDDPRNNLLGEFTRIVKETEPKYFVMENVSGLTSGQSIEVLHKFIDEIQEAEYEVLSYRVLNAAHYGVPQDRKRLIVIGHRKDVQAPAYPEAHTAIRGKKGLQGLQTSFFLPWCPSIDDAISDLPDIDQYGELLQTDELAYKCHPESEYAKCLHDPKRDDNDYSYPRKWDSSKLTNCLRTKHTPISMKRFAETKGGETEAVSRFFRLHPEGISNTLRAGTDSKRGAHTSPRPIHPVYPRCISVREAARIHSFPDWFRLHMTKWHGFRQIGNSVPPLLSRAIANEIMKALQVSPIKPEHIIELGNTELLKMDMSTAAQHFGVPKDVIGSRDRKRYENEKQSISSA